jgi:hypothetical protein
MQLHPSHAKPGLQPSWLVASQHPLLKQILSLAHVDTQTPPTQVSQFLQSLVELHKQTSKSVDGQCPQLSQIMVPEIQLLANKSPGIDSFISPFESKCFPHGNAIFPLVLVISTVGSLHGTPLLEIFEKFNVTLAIYSLIFCSFVILLLRVDARCFIWISPA